MGAGTAPAAHLGIAAVAAAATCPFVEVEADCSWLVAALSLDWVTGRAVVVLVVWAGADRTVGFS